MPAPSEAEDETKVVDRESKLAAKPEDDPRPQSPSDSGQPDLVAAHPLVGRYEVVHRLGHGGMATVYLGRAIGTAGFERLVAVKVIHPHLAREPEFVEMFLDEARIAARIHHPNVVEILDLGQDDELFFMVMEYVEGETLSSLLRQLVKHGERLPLPAALQIVADACKGLAAAHDQVDRDGEPLHLVHRDVSPHNLLVTMDGRVKVVDFGIMKAAGKRSNTLTGQLRGKIAYMSPQQARGEPVDRRADVFALGAVLWEMLTGQRLFSGETEAETLDKVLHHEPPDLGAVRDDLPDAGAKIVRKALATHADDRYESAQQMLKDVRALLRQVEGEDEPRELLALRMAKFFSGRVEYIRATIRGTAGNMRDPAARSSGLHAVGDISKTTPLGSASSPLRLTPSGAPLQTGTSTATVNPGPVRSWTLWLLLPLAGAAIGTAAVSGGWVGDAAPQTAALEREEPSQEPPDVVGDVAPKEDEEDDTDPEPQIVAWVINSDPQGATILIDGEPHPEPTPTVVKLPRSEKTVLVVAEYEGYERSETMKLAPLTSQNLPTFRLQPIPAATEAATSPRKSYPKFSARTLSEGRPKKTSKARSRGSTKKASSSDAATEGTTPDSKKDERTLQEMPDFDGGLK